MKFCQSHWEKLRAAIDQRGLTAFVAKDGTVAVAQMAKQVEENRSGKDTFDPLMSAHWSVSGNVFDMLGRAGMNPLYLMCGDEEEVVDATLYPAYKGRRWSRCPLCYINLAHELSCTDQACKLDREAGYDWMIDRAADDALTQARDYGLVP